MRLFFALRGTSNGMFDIREGGFKMATHHGGKVGSAAAKLASSSTGKTAKSKAGKTLANHKHQKH